MTHEHDVRGARFRRIWLAADKAGSDPSYLMLANFCPRLGDLSNTAKLMAELRLMQQYKRTYLS